MCGGREINGGNIATIKQGRDGAPLSSEVGFLRRGRRGGGGRSLTRSRASRLAIRASFAAGRGMRMALAKGGDVTSQQDCFGRAR